MKSSKSTTKDVFLGLFVIIMFLIFGTVLEDPLLLFYDTKFEDFLISLPTSLVLVPFIGITIVNIYFAIIANTNNRNMLFKSAIIITFISLFSHIISLLTPNDSNPLILLFIPIATIFYPSGALFEASFSGVEFYFLDYTEDWLIYLVIVVTTFIIPLVTYFSIKTYNKKKHKKLNIDDKIDLTENKD